MKKKAIFGLLLSCFFVGLTVEAFGYELVVRADGKAFTEINDSDYDFNSSFPDGIRLNLDLVDDSPNTDYVFIIPPSSAGTYSSLQISVNGSGYDGIIFGKAANFWINGEPQDDLKTGFNSVPVGSPSSYIVQQDGYATLTLTIEANGLFKYDLDYVKIELHMNTQNEWLDYYMRDIGAYKIILNSADLMREWDGSAVAADLVMEGMIKATSFAKELLDVGSDGLIDAVQATLDSINAFSSLVDTMRKSLNWNDVQSTYLLHSTRPKELADDLQEIADASEDTHTPSIKSLADMWLTYGADGELGEIEKQELQAAMNSSASILWGQDGDSGFWVVRNFIDGWSNVKNAHASENDSIWQWVQEAFYSVRPLVYWNMPTRDPCAVDYDESKSFLKKYADDLLDHAAVIVPDSPKLSGNVSTSGGSDISEATVSANNGGGSDSTSSSGYYEFTVPYGWSGTVTPTKSGYSFSTSPRTYSAPVTSDLSNQNFTGNDIAPSGSTTGTLYAIEDSFTASASPNDNYGSDSQFFAGSFDSSIYYSFLKFNCSSIPEGSTVHDANLKMYCDKYWPSDSGNTELNIAVWGSAWSENSVTWSTQPASGTGVNVWKSIPATGWLKFEHIQITDVVGEWVNGTRNNYGFKLYGIGTSSYHSSEQSSYKPKLEVTYTPPPLPDLIVTDVSPGTSPSGGEYYTGQSVGWNVTIKNVGLGAAENSDVGYYLGAHSSDLSNRINSDPTSALDPDDTNSDSDSYTFQESDVGTRYIICKANYNGDIDEINNGNNTGYYGSFTVVSAPPDNVSDFTATSGDTQIQLTWSNPGDSDFDGVKIMRKMGGYPSNKNDGTQIYNDSGTVVVDTGLSNGTKYYYKAFSYDTSGNYANGSSANETPYEILTHYVSSSGSHTWPYADWSSAANDIQTAVDLADTGDTVLVSNGTYDVGGKAISWHPQSRVCITSAITVQSVNGPDVTIIKGAPGANGGCDEDAVRGVYLENGGVLSGFTVTNGHSKNDFGSYSSKGGGVFIQENGIVSNSVIRGNCGIWGGGVQLWNGGTLIDCIISENTAEDCGGGAFLQNGGELVDCQLSENTSVFDGGGASIIDSGTLTRCALTNNSAGREGGGVHLSTSWESENPSGGILNNCLIADNVAHHAGGVFLSADCIVSNCVMIGNCAEFGGAGAYLYQGGELVDCQLSENTSVFDGGGASIVDSGTLTRCALTNNSAGRNGGGVYLSPGWESENPPGGVLNNCLIADNVAGHGGGAFLQNGGELVDCQLSENTSVFDGGGASIVDSGTLTRCALTNNSAGRDGDRDGGGVNLLTWWESENPPGGVLNNCLIADNVAGQGGGVRVQHGGSLNSCIIKNNTAVFGGGVNLYRWGDEYTSPRVLNNCLITKNLAHAEGGGVLSDEWGASRLALNNCTISGNSADDTGGVKLNKGVLNNCVVWQNASSESNRDILKEGVGESEDDIIRNTCSPDVEHGVNGNITNNPILVSVSHLAPGSPCRGAGDPAYASGADIDGEAWLNPPSMGCDEYHGLGTVIGSLRLSLSGQTHVCVGFPAIYSVDVQGASTQTQIDFDDGTVSSGGFDLEHAWAVPGVYDVTLTAFNDEYPSGVSATQKVHVFTADASAVYVSDSTGNDANDGQSWATAKKTIQAGVDVQNVHGGIVWVTNGTYSVSSEVSVQKTLRLSSVNGSNVTIVDGGGNSRCFKIEAKNSSISGFTIANGQTSGDWDDGGGVDCTDGSVMVSRCVLSGNSAGSGGGMSKGTAYNCTFTGNSATYSGGGGGMSRATAYNCTFTGNSAAYSGGGMSRGRVYNCTFTGNSAARSGGGVNGCVVYNSVVWGNTALRDENTPPDNVYYSCSPDVEHGVNGNITNNPLLASASHIATNSPCRGTGSAAYASGTDIDGETWLNPPSMGCDEYHGLGTITGPLQLSLFGSTNICVGISGRYFVDILGAPVKSVIDFGGGNIFTNRAFLEHSWAVPGVYDVVLTAFNDEHLSGVSATQAVHVLSVEESSIYVSESSGSDANTGTSWLTARQTIQSGVDVQSVHGGIVWITNGTYYLSSEVSVDKPIRLLSVNGPEATIVDGGGTTRCFNLSGSSCLISGLTITNGYSDGSGGGVFCLNLYPTVTNCVIVDNEAPSGGGGGMRNGRAYNCVISDNFSAGGGAGASYSIVHNCTFTGNMTYYDGGGMFRGEAYNSIFTGNEASDGGGMSDGIAYNCTFVGNTAAFGGGMAYGAVYNCILWQNTAAHSGDNLTGTTVHHSCSPDLTHRVDGNTTNTPLLVDEAGGDFHLQSNSLCINWGDNSFVYTDIDRDGNTRIVGKHVDMGAYEYQVDLGEDGDSDGVLDEWERAYYGFNIDPNAVCSNGLNTIYQAYVAGFDPNDPNSKFLVSILPSRIMQWNAVSGRVYSVYWSTNLLDGFQPLESNIPWTVGSFTDSVHSAESRCFYKVDVQLEAAVLGPEEVLVASSQTNASGSRTLSWPAAQDNLSPTYTVWYTTSLSNPWILLTTQENLTSYIDDEHNGEPVIFYKVTAQ